LEGAGEQAWKLDSPVAIDVWLMSNREGGSGSGSQVHVYVCLDSLAFFDQIMIIIPYQYREEQSPETQLIR
jgi:hypothetical protein